MTKLLAVGLVYSNSLLEPTSAVEWT